MGWHIGLKESTKKWNMETSTGFGVIDILSGGVFGVLCMSKSLFIPSVRSRNTVIRSPNDVFKDVSNSCCVSALSVLASLLERN